MKPEDERNIRDLIRITLRDLMVFDVRTQDNVFIVHSNGRKVELPATDFHPSKELVNGSGCGMRFINYVRKNIMKPLFGEQKNGS